MSSCSSVSLQLESWQGSPQLHHSQRRPKARHEVRPTPRVTELRGVAVRLATPESSRKRYHDTAAAELDHRRVDADTILQFSHVRKPSPGMLTSAAIAIVYVILLAGVTNIVMQHLILQCNIKYCIAVSNCNCNIKICPSITDFFY